MTRYPDMAFGAIVAVAKLVGCVRIEEIRARAARGTVHWIRLFRHKHTEGPICWVLVEVVRLERPIAIAGARGLWDVPDKVRDDMLHILAEVRRTTTCQDGCSAAS